MCNTFYPTRYHFVGANEVGDVVVHRVYEDENGNGYVGRASFMSPVELLEDFMPAYCYTGNPVSLWLAKRVMKRVALLLLTK